jgi:hypothetical protein
MDRRISMSDVYSNVVETMIRRYDPLKNHAPAPTIFNLDKIQYVFQPRPELTGDLEASVCIVISQEHRDYLLTDSRCKENFRAYVPKEKAPAEIQEKAMFQAWMELRNTMSAEDILKMTQANVAAEGNELVGSFQVETPPDTAIKAVEGLEPIGGNKKKAKPMPDAEDVVHTYDPPETGGSGKLDLASLEI